MKNKRLIILISIFAFIILVVILCSTLFTVKTVSVNWLTRLPEGHILINKDDDIAADVEKGGSIFLYDKQSAITSLEESYPYLKVVKVETKFPNKLVVHVADRQEVFALKINDNCYVVLDGECKVLTKYNALQYSAISLPPICVEIKEQTLVADDFEVGKVANISRISTILSNVYSALTNCGYEDVYMKQVIQNITIDLGYNASLVLDTSYANLSVKINKIHNNLYNKLVFGLAAYNEARAEGSQQTNGVIVIRELSNGKLDGEFVKNE